jgi:hypothetical protein
MTSLALGTLVVWCASFADGALQGLDVVVGIGSDLGSAVGTAARDVPALLRLGGVAVSDDHAVIAGDTLDGPVVLVFAPAAPGDDIADATTWTLARVFADESLVLLAGVSFDREADRFLVVDEGDACVRAVDVDLGIAADAVAGVCGQAADAPGFLDAPRAAVAAGGDIFVSDTANHRVLRFTSPDVGVVVIGDGSNSVAGAGAPARDFAVAAPEQLAFDTFGNLYITSTSVVRLVTDVLDNDNDNDTVFTIFGRDRSDYPASEAFCLRGLNPIGVGVDSGVVVADACQGFVVRLRSVTP